MAGRHQCDRTEHNYVAEAFNWEQRIKGENEAARAWTKNWGEIYAPNSPKTHMEKIHRLQQEMKKLPVQAMMSNSQLSYTPVVPYQEFGKDYKRKSSTLCDEPWLCENDV